DTDYRYVPVRRFLIGVEQSIKRATAAFVFEPNDANTWVKVRGMIENFLFELWRAGALQGNKPENAFYVKVGLGTTMTPQDLLDGRMIVVIGLATVRPAEFVIVSLAQLMPKP
ncbi:MAG TPA: phage tail sheath C-terminal domain-containing protein, partial [Reyranella sp.]|nr:phage tail sheath C-terminal domain-containing protein [Reyranella sp.]